MRFTAVDLAATRRSALLHLDHLGWVLVYLLAACAVLVGVAYPPAEWLASVAFVLSLASMVFHMVRASLTRRFMPVRMLIGLNVVVLAATAIARERLSLQASAALVASVPLLSYFCFFGWQLAFAPPRPGEALRPAKLLRECHPINRLAVGLVLFVEFAQFNALAFNPALGAWKDLPSLDSFFSYSFFVFTSEEDYFEQTLWVFCALGFGWVLFASVALLISRHQASHGGATERQIEQQYTSSSSSGKPSSSASAHGVVGSHHGSSAAAAEASAIEASSDFTMRSPVILVVRLIGRTGIRILKGHVAGLRRCKDAATHLVWGARSIKPACCGVIALVPVAPILVFALFCATMLTGAITFAVAMFVACGLAVCGAFAAIALLHFPILMNMLSVLNCEYAEDGTEGLMGRMPSQRCWHGRHWLFAGASVVTIALLYPVMIHFERKRQSAAEVSYHVRFTSCMLIGKLALSACSAILVTALPAPVYLLLCGSLLVFFLHVNNQREQDEQPACCNVRTVRLLRSMLLSCALCSLTTTLASTVLTLPSWALAVSLVVLWLLTIGYFGVIIKLPQHEPTYDSEPPQLAVSGGTTAHCKHAPSTNPALTPNGAHHAHHPATPGGGVAASFSSPPRTLSHHPQHTLSMPVSSSRYPHASRTPAPQHAASFSSPPVHGTPGAGCPTAAIGRTPGGGGGGGAGPSPMVTPASSRHFSATAVLMADERRAAASSAADHANGSSNGRGSSHGSSRTVYLAPQPSHRPLVAFYEFDDGFDTSTTWAASDDHGGGGSTEAAVPPDELVPIVLAAQLQSLSLGGGGACTAGGGLLGGGASAADAELRAGDVITAINGEGGLPACEVASRLETMHGPLALTVRRAVPRQAAGKRSRAASCLRDFPVRYVAQCMMMYPQDAELQRAGCERLARAVIDASQRSMLSSLIAEVRGAFLLPVVVNAMEVHVDSPPVLTAAARLLCCLANTEGHLRANVVAAGALPALCAALKAHTGATEVHALCDLAAEIASARGAPPGSRRAMCEAIAATQTLKVVLKALRGHVSHEGVVAACCRVLLAYQEEFEGTGALPPALPSALRLQETLTTLEEAQRRFAHVTEIQLGAEWAVGVGRAARSARTPGGAGGNNHARSTPAANRSKRLQQGGTTTTTTDTSKPSPRAALQPLARQPSGGLGGADGNADESTRGEAERSMKRV